MQTIRGFGDRRGNWEYSASVTQEVMPRPIYRRCRVCKTRSTLRRPTISMSLRPISSRIASPRRGISACRMAAASKSAVSTTSCRRSLASRRTISSSGWTIWASNRTRCSTVSTSRLARDRAAVCSSTAASRADGHDSVSAMRLWTIRQRTFGLTGATFWSCDYTSGWLTQAKVNGSLHHSMAGHPDWRRDSESPLVSK